MSTKKVVMGTKPSNKPVVAPSSDQWVENRDEAADKEATKRLTLDIPESLHRRIKMDCASRGTKIVQEVTALLDAHYAKQ
ncbi:hypothetical protein [Janthinobacterium sp. CG_23.4]|uniref:hypothetical protein n=1 Tax=Janthinobacterium sp. CG_23.4 TaxID=2760707 RepID=UPI0024741E37|nr:hypothetical protein [Janthinobacterium sp. CG_23.4]MDH6160331.1 hypothetical protein [Janthinobacterium sp. CG_23.4]